MTVRIRSSWRLGAVMLTVLGTAVASGVAMNAMAQAGGDERREAPPPPPPHDNGPRDEARRPHRDRGGVPEDLKARLREYIREQVQAGATFDEIRDSLLDAMPERFQKIARERLAERRDAMQGFRGPQGGADDRRGPDARPNRERGRRWQEQGGPRPEGPRPDDQGRGGERRGGRFRGDRGEMGGRPIPSDEGFRPGPRGEGRGMREGKRPGMGPDKRHDGRGDERRGMGPAMDRQGPPPREAGRGDFGPRPDGDRGPEGGLQRGPDRDRGPGPDGEGRGPGNRGPEGREGRPHRDQGPRNDRDGGEMGDRDNRP